MAAALVWEREGPSWPLRDTSRFVSAAGITWHVQVYGRGPAVLLLHGTAASTHSWRAFGPVLAERFTVIAVDLPGHGFTARPPYHLQTLGGSAAGLAALLETIGYAPEWVIGHSAGAAILARMALDGYIAPHLLISLNGAFLPFSGLAGQLFPTTVRLLNLNPLVPFWLALRAHEPGFIKRLIAQTGSRLDAEGIRLYRRLASSPRHVAGAVGMMAASHDDLHTLVEDLPRLKTPVLLFAAERDGAVPPAQAERVCRYLSNGRVVVLPGLGHLAHEERPREVAERVFAATEAALKGLDSSPLS